MGYDITLYTPPSFYYAGWHYDCLPPLSLCIFARMLKDAGMKAQVIDLEALEIRPENIELPQSNVVGFTGLSIAAQGIEDSIRALREKGYTGRIVVGGIHATLRPQEVLDMGADLVVTGECDGNFIELMIGSQTGIVEGVPLPIDEIASPDWDACNPAVTKYKGQYKILSPLAGVGMWQRGCPFDCVFCGNVIFSRQKTRYRSPEIIAKEMRDLHSRGIKRVYVYDDELVGTKPPNGWMKEIADLIEPLDMLWVTQARCSERYITAEVMKDMYRAGCRMIFWGVESLSSNVLKAIDKHMTVADVEHSLRLSTQAGIKNSLYMMVGSYKETEADLQDTQGVLKRLYLQGLVDNIQVFIAKVYPGARLEAIAKQDGWYTNLEDNMLLTRDAYSTPWMTRKQIKLWRNNLMDACPVGKP